MPYVAKIINILRDRIYENAYLASHQRRDGPIENALFRVVNERRNRIEQAHFTRIRFGQSEQTPDFARDSRDSLPIDGAIGT